MGVEGGIDGAGRVMASAASNASDSHPAAESTRFLPYRVVDQEQGGLVVGTIAVPEGWNAYSRVRWTYSDVSFPVRASLRVESPDRNVWMEAYPAELFYWLEPGDPSTPIGGKTLGMIHAPGIGADDALMRYVVGRYRGSAEGLEVVGLRRIPNLSQALGKQPMAGDSIAARVRYTLDGRPVDEEFFAILGETVRIPYTGPQGTTYEMHRLLNYVHSMGAKDGKLDSMNPLLGYVVASFVPDPTWERHAQQVLAQLSAQFNQYIAQGYEQIAAAGRLSRAISANNDAMLQSMETQRQATWRSEQKVNDDFSQYIRGTERMEDPYWGTSDHSYNEKYHWTDGLGSYQHSNDANYNPNIGSNTNWQLMERVK
jgi:hypothetical protein